MDILGNFQLGVTVTDAECLSLFPYADIWEGDEDLWGECVWQVNCH